MASRRSVRLTLTGLALLCSSALTLTACGGSGSSSTGTGTGSVSSSLSGTPVKGGTVEVLADANFSHLDPALGFDGGVNNFYRLIYRTLVTSSPGTKGATYEPDLATDLGTPSDDAKVWKFTLKDGITFQDGTPITSADVRFGVERTFDPALSAGSPYARTYLAGTKGYTGPFNGGKHLSSIETPDAKTIIFHLNQSVADFAAVTAQNTFVPLPAGKGGTTTYDKKPVASGPYQVDSYQPGSTLTLVRNPHFDPATDTVRKAYPDKFEWRFGIDDSTANERALADQGEDKNQAGVVVQPSSIARLSQPGVTGRTFQAPTTCTTYLGLNTTKGPLKKLAVRQAVSYAVDKKQVQTATGGSKKATIVSTMLPPTLAGHKDFDLYPSPDSSGDPAKAKQLLSEAGYPNGFTMTLDIRNLPAMQAQAEALQQSLLKAGITVKLNVIDSATYYEVIGTTSQQHDAAITGWCPDWPSGRSFLPPLFDGRTITSKGNSNLAQIDDPAINAAVDKVNATPSVEAANAGYGDLDELILKQAPVVPLNVENTVQVFGSNVTGVQSTPAFSGFPDLVLVGLKKVE